MTGCTLQASKELLREHYADLKTKKFFNGLVDFMASGPVVCMVGCRVGRGRLIPLSTTTVSCDAVFQLVQFVLCKLDSSCSGVVLVFSPGVGGTGGGQDGQADARRDRPGEYQVGPHKVSGR